MLCRLVQSSIWKEKIYVPLTSSYWIQVLSRTEKIFAMLTRNSSMGRLCTWKRKQQLWLSVSLTHLPQFLYIKNNMPVDNYSAGKDNFAEFRKRLSGKLEYSPPCRELDEFEGFLKLQKDPKTERLTSQNLILRGSVLKNTDWYYSLTYCSF